jgi:hypothetical protein
MKKTLLVLFGAIAINIAQAQETNTESPLDTLAKSVEGIQSDLKLLSKIKFSGYVQAQWQKADTIGSPSVAGGNFSGLDNRFQIRRARLKAAYAGENTQVAIQFDLKDDGSVKVKEAYGIYSEPWLKTFAVTAGIFNRPIGYEVEYSSSVLESPERSRIMQTLFPDECDMGAKLTIQAPKTSPWNFIKLDVGAFNGNAIASETDKYKDIIAHLSLKKSFLDENLQLGGGVSFYNGGWANNSGAMYKYNKDSLAFVKDASKTTKGQKAERNYLGIDLQATLSTAAGLTTLRGEYLMGTQTGTSGSSTSPKGAMFNGTKDVMVVDSTSAKKVLDQVTTSATIPADAYSRKFSGGYVMLIHRLMQTKHEFVVKYDWYDPNTEISGDEIGTKSKLNKTTGAADIKFTTIGIGWNYYLTTNLKFSVYYDMVSNEKTKNIVTTNGTTNYSKDLKDNVLTLRALYKF